MQDNGCLTLARWKASLLGSPRLLQASESVVLNNSLCRVVPVPAGRMQDNEPLMRALSNLINLNQPDLVLFVGEALVGNDAGE